MNTQRIVLLLILLAALPIAAQPITITSVSPSTGPTAGGITVTIKGTGFEMCPICSPPTPPAVKFGHIPAASTSLVDSQTLLAGLPPFLPASVDVTVEQWNSTAVEHQAFTYIGSGEEEFERILLPVFMRPIPGAFGSEFRTEFRAWNRGFGLPLNLYGIDTSCSLADPPRGPETPFILGQRGTELDTEGFICNERVGRILWVPRGRSDDLAANLRVRDTSREEEGAGTEIPVVRERDFLYRNVALLNVPLHKKFRQTLRIYALGSGLVEANVDGVVHVVPLTPGLDVYEPGYAEFTNFPPPPETGIRRIRVEVHAPSAVVIGTFVPIWAMVTVTNNETQQITAITPN